MASFSATRWYYIWYAGLVPQYQFSALQANTQNSTFLAVPAEGDASYWWQLVPSRSWTPSNLVYLLRNHNSGPAWYLDTYCLGSGTGCATPVAITEMEAFPDNVDQPRTQWQFKASDARSAAWALGTYQLFNGDNGTDWMLTCDDYSVRLTNNFTDGGIYWAFVPAGIISESSFLDIAVSFPLRGCCLLPLSSATIARDMTDESQDCADPSSSTYLECHAESGLSAITKGLIALAVSLSILLGAACAFFWRYRRRKQRQIAEMRQSKNPYSNVVNDDGLQLAQAQGPDDTGGRLPDFAFANDPRRNSSAVNSERSMSRPPNLREQRESSSLVELASPSVPVVMMARNSVTIPGTAVSRAEGKVD